MPRSATTGTLLSASSVFVVVVVVVVVVEVVVVVGVFVPAYPGVPSLLWL